MSQYELDRSLDLDTWRTLDRFEQSYIEAAMWTLTGNEGESLDYLGLHDIARATLAAARADCAAFREAAGTLLDDADDTQAGHDFWLTRNWHGAGFWDRSPDTYPNDPEGEKLTEIAHTFGEADWYLGDDGEVYQSGAEATS
jgi:hypothetical protein